MHTNITSQFPRGILWEQLTILDSRVIVVHKTEIYLSFGDDSKNSKSPLPGTLM